MKKKKDAFREVKVKLVMKLRNLSRDAAIAEIARMDAAHRADADGSKCRNERRGRGLNASRTLAPNDDGDLMMSAEEFFNV